MRWARFGECGLKIEYVEKVRLWYVLGRGARPEGAGRSSNVRVVGVLAGGGDGDGEGGGGEEGMKLAQAANRSCGFIVTCVVSLEWDVVEMRLLRCKRLFFFFFFLYNVKMISKIGKKKYGQDEFTKS